MKRSTDRILTTHCGSLARPSALLDLMRARAAGEATDPRGYDEQVKQAVADVVVQQRACGIDFVGDGEQSKPGFFAYVAGRLDGFDGRDRSGPGSFQAEIDAFPSTTSSTSSTP